MFQRRRQSIESLFEKTLFASRWLLALSDRLTGEAKSAAPASKSKADVGEAPPKGRA